MVSQPIRATDTLDKPITLTYLSQETHLYNVFVNRTAGLKQVYQAISQYICLQYEDFFGHILLENFLEHNKHMCHFYSSLTIKPKTITNRHCLFLFEYC